MQAREYHTIDKSDWGQGAWSDEPDKRQWADPETGLPCLFKRNDMGVLCGYVGVPPGHPAYGKGYDDDDLDDIEVHGGLTFADHCQADAPEEHSICHVPDPGEPDHVWWLGFDCNHLRDYAPAQAAYLSLSGFRFSRHEDFYRTQAYVEAEVRELARQLAAMATETPREAVGAAADQREA